MTVYKIFKDNNCKLSESEKRIIEFINKDPMIFLSINIIEYAKITFSSKSCITRLSKKLGFKSLYDMKLFVQQEITKNNFYFDTLGEKSIDDRIRNLRTYINYAVNETLIYLNLVIFHDVCKKLVEAKQILIFGVASSFLAANELANNLQRIKINATCSADVHNAILKVSTFNENDLLITFCKSGLTKEVRFLNEIAKNMNAKTLMITANTDIIDNLDYKILLKEIEKERRIIATSSKISQLVIADAIFFEVNKLIHNDTINQYALDFLQRWKYFR